MWGQTSSKFRARLRMKGLGLRARGGLGFYEVSARVQAT